MGSAEEFLAAAVRTGTPLALAALGETVVECAGVINVGLEGIVLAGAFGGLLAAGSGLVAGFAGALVAGKPLDRASCCSHTDRTRRRP